MHHVPGLCAKQLHGEDMHPLCAVLLRPIQAQLAVLTNLQTLPAVRCQTTYLLLQVSAGDHRILLQRGGPGPEASGGGAA